MEPFLIRPSKDLRNHYGDIAKLCHEQNAAIAVTVNGRQDTVLVSHEQYMAQQAELNEMKSKLSLYTHLAQSRDDIRLGRGYTVDEVFDELQAQLEALR